MRVEAIWKGDRAARAVRTATPKALLAVALAVVGAAKKLAPVDSGNLRGSIVHKVLNHNSIRVGTGVHYAAHVEFGTVKMSAQPYLRPAVENNTVKLNQLFRAVIRAALRSAL